ncbi:MAG: class I SAM-dependent methyltransferase [Candidatus Bathyarchaeota archaeon]
MFLAPFVPTSFSCVTEMLQLAELQPDEVLVDLGCGDGRIILEAALNFGARAIGVELDDGRYRECVKKVHEAHLEDRVKIIHGDLLQVDLKKADVVTLYLLPSTNKKVKSNLERDLRKGSRVVSHDFQIPGWSPTKIKEHVDNWGPNISYSYNLEDLEQTYPPFNLTIPPGFSTYTLYLYQI